MNGDTKAYTILLRDRGQLTIPRSVREQLPITDSDILTLLQTNGLLIVAPQELRLPALQARFREAMEEASLRLAELLKCLAAEREAIYCERSRGRSEESAQDLCQRLIRRR